MEPTPVVEPIPAGEPTPEAEPNLAVEPALKIDPNPVVPILAHMTVTPFPIPTPAKSGIKTSLPITSLSLWLVGAPPSPPFVRSYLNPGAPGGRIGDESSESINSNFL